MYDDDINNRALVSVVASQQTIMPYLPPGAQFGRWREPVHPVALWLANTRRELTAEAYGRDLRDFALWLARERHVPDPLLAEFADVLAYRNHLAELGLKRSTQHKKLMALASLYSFLVKIRVLVASPMLALNVPDADDGVVKRAWTREEIYAFMAAIPADGQMIHIRDNALFGLLLWNGLRVGEVCGARIGDLTIKLGAQVLEIKEQGMDDQHVKRGQSRDAVLIPRTYERIEQYLARRGLTSGGEIASDDLAGDWRGWPLFVGVHDAGPRGGRRRRTPGDSEELVTTPPAPTSGGYKLTRMAVLRRMLKYGGAAGLDPDILEPHYCRHTALSHLVEAGITLEKLQQFSGHKSLQSVQNYIHAREIIANNAAWSMPY